MYHILCLINTLTFRNCVTSSASSLALSYSLFIVNCSLFLVTCVLLLDQIFGLGFGVLGNDKLLIGVDVISGVVGLMYGRISYIRLMEFEQI